MIDAARCAPRHPWWWTPRSTWRPSRRSTGRRPWCARWRAHAVARGRAGAVRRPGAPLKVVFYGLYTPLQGTPVIGEALGRPRRRAVEVTMIRPRRRRRRDQGAAAANQSVRWLGWVPAAELPALVPRHDVCLGSSATATRRCAWFPTRCSGSRRRVRGHHLRHPPQRRVLGDAAVLCRPVTRRRWPTARFGAGQ